MTQKTLLLSLPRLGATRWSSKTWAERTMIAPNRDACEHVIFDGRKTQSLSQSFVDESVLQIKQRGYVTLEVTNIPTERIMKYYKDSCTLRDIVLLNGQGNPIR